MYNNFSDVYDRFMEQVDYVAWVAFIEKAWESRRPALVLDLACGTGNMTIPLAKAGYDMIGVDISPEMLAQARLKAGAGSGILFLEQDMRELELYGTVDACICMVDGLNYMIEEGDLLAVFRLVENYLNPGGLFIFDMNTIFKFSEIMGDSSFCDKDEHAAVLWDNFYDNETGINEYCLTAFIEDEKTGLYHRYEEIHYQRGYELAQVVSFLKKAGLAIRHIYGDIDFSGYTETSEKFFIVAEKPTGKISQ